MVSVPNEIKYGLVTGRLIRSILDTPTTDERYGEAEPIIDASISFVPSVDKIVLADSTPPVIIYISTFTVNTDPDGFIISPDKQTGVYLIATDNTTAVPNDWYYNVTITAKNITQQTYKLFVPSDKTTDISTVVIPKVQNLPD